MRVALVLTALAALCSSQTQKPPEQLSDVSVQDYIAALQAIDDAALQRAKDIKTQADAAKDELYASWSDKIKQIATQKQLEDAEKTKQLQDAKDQLMTEFEAEVQKIYQQTIAASVAYKESLDAAREAERKDVEDRINAFKAKVNQTIEDNNAAYKARLNEINEYLKQVDNMYNQHKAESEAQLAARQQALKDKFTKLFADLDTRSTDLDAQAAALKAQISDFLSKKQQLQTDQKNVANELLNEGLTELLEQGLQQKLNSELQQVVQEEIAQKLSDAKFAYPPANDGATPAYEASLLDTLTGASAWETVAWVLLALCILLTVALIALIAYQVSQRNKYEKLGGHDSRQPKASTHSGPGERSPLITAPPLGYSTEKEAPAPVTTAPVTPGRVPSPVVASTSAAALPPPPPAVEQQQF